MEVAPAPRDAQVDDGAAIGFHERMIPRFPVGFPSAILYPRLRMSPACPQCGAEECTVLVSSLRDRFRPQDAYRIARCRACRLAFTDPVRDSYPESYEPFQFEDPVPRTTGVRGAILDAFYRGKGGRGTRALLFVPSLLFRARDRMKVHARDLYARPFRRRGRLLDVGCGGGDTLRAWVGQQDHCIGLETDPRAAAVARERLGLDVRCGRLEDQGFPAASFDVITLSHVLEHVPRPRDVLARCAELLRPDGELLVWVPNFASPLRGLFGADWFPYEVPRHRWHFRPQDLHRLLRDAGLRPVEIAFDANEHAFRKSARALPSWPGVILRRRTARLLAMLACRMARRTDVIRVRAVKPTRSGSSRAP